MKFGLTNVVPVTAAPHWSAMLGKYGFSAVPSTGVIDYLKLLPDDSGMMGNNAVGNCFWAAQYHGRQARTRQVSGTLVSEPDSVILGAYGAATGYSPGDASSDRGTDPAMGFSWLAANGLPTSSAPVRMLGAIELDPRNYQDCLNALDACCGLMVGFTVPQWMMRSPSPPPVWDFAHGDALTNEGHEIWVGRGDGWWNDIGLCSWGLKYSMTRGFWDSCVNQVTAVIYEDWFRAGLSPFNITEAQLESEMLMLRAGMIP